MALESETVSRFGLGYLLLPFEQEVRILTAMGWDGESLPYPLLVQFFKDTINDALEKVEQIDPCPIVQVAIQTGSYMPSGIPDKTME